MMRLIAAYLYGRAWLLSGAPLTTVILEIFIQDFLVFLIFMVFNFSFLYQNLRLIVCKKCIFKFLVLDSNKNYMTMKIYMY